MCVYRMTIANRGLLLLTFMSACLFIEYQLLLDNWYEIVFDYKLQP